MKKIIKSLALSLCAAVLITALPFQVLAKPKKLSKNIKVGESVYFGKYEQDGNTDNGKEKIEWQVLSKKGGKALLISKHILDVKPYNKEFKDITWEESTLRKWLNKIFINNAFNEKEKKRIRKTQRVDNYKIKGNDMKTDKKNTRKNNIRGYNTKEKVFLLSTSEAEIYFDSDKERIAEVTDYTMMKLYESLSEYWKETESEVRQWFEEREEGRNWWYWLRSSGAFHGTAALVGDDGSVDGKGLYVSSVIEGVRPAIWVNL